MNPETQTLPGSPRLRLAILQRVCPPYRRPLFMRLSSLPDVEMRLFIGDDVPNSKVKNATELDGINFQRLPTRFPKVGSRVLPWHVGLIGELRKFDPDVILSEGESHFLGYMQAILFKLFVKPRVGLMHWCFISLPGWTEIGGTGFRAWVKRMTRRFFDAFVVYSSFSKDCLVHLGQSGEKIFVATNVGDIGHWIRASSEMPESREEARTKLGLPRKFTVLYTGTLDEVKRPEVMLDLAGQCHPEKFHFVLLGSGGMLEELRARAAHEGLTNVFLPGRVVKELSLYYRAADVLLIPGRGGIVISEAMAFGLPVVVHEADGTEHDLVQDKVTGIQLGSGTVADFRAAVEWLASNPETAAEMGHRSEELLKSRFTTENMVLQIIRAARYARSSVQNGDGKRGV